MNSYFFIADSHFGHTKSIEFGHRPFRSVDEMNQYMIKQWNAKVGAEDKVFVLGDFAMGPRKNLVEFGKALNGRKILILGNHDHGKKSTYLDAGFEEVIRFPILWNGSYLLSHAPKFEDDIGTLFNIYGHVHNQLEYEDINEKGICVSVERIGYAPISFEEIEKKRKNLNKK